MKLDSADLQVVDKPATGPGPEGSTIVLLHCYACSLEWWQDVEPLLNRNHRIIEFDLIGFGGSEKPGSGYSIDDQSRAVAQALNELGVQGAVVVGHSMGGLVATSLAQNSSQLVDRVAVIGTASDISEDAALPFTARLAYTPVLGEAIWRLVPASLVKKNYEKAFAPGFDYEAAFEDPDQVLVDNEAMTYTSFKEASAESADFTDEATVASRITDAAVPFMAILGSEDQITDTDATAEAYGGVPGAEVEVLDGVGHSAELEAPDKTAALVERFSRDAPTPDEIAAEAKALQPPEQAPAGGKRAKKKPAAAGNEKPAAGKKKPNSG
jgi:pimeloyl-ACP methyl ester carboxylesterase